MAVWKDKMAVIEADAVYVDGVLAGRDFNVTLPEVVPTTVDVGGLMGTMSIPLLSSLESIAMTVTKVGIDADLARLCKPGKKTLRISWVQDRIKSDGTVAPVGAKAEVSCFPKAYMPAGAIEIGSVSENDVELEVYEYKLTVDGTTVFYLNRLTNTLQAWDGKDLVNCAASFDTLLK